MSTSTSYKVRGSIVHIDARPEQIKGSDQQVKFLHLLVDAGSAYEHTLCFAIMGKTMDALGRYQIGDVVDVTFNIRSQQYMDTKTGKARFYTNLKAWQIRPPQTHDAFNG